MTDPLENTMCEKCGYVLPIPLSGSACLGPIDMKGASVSMILALAFRSGLFGSNPKALGDQDSPCQHEHELVLHKQTECVCRLYNYTNLHIVCCQSFQPFRSTSVF